MEHQAPNWIRRVAAVSQNILPSRVALGLLILAEGTEEIHVQPQRSMLGANRFAQRDHDRMARLLAVTPAVAQIFFPGVQQLEGPSTIRDFVAEIVRPAAICIDVVEMLVQMPRKEPGDHSEILVMVRG